MEIIFLLYNSLTHLQPSADVATTCVERGPPRHLGCQSSIVEPLSLTLLPGNAEAIKCFSSQDFKGFSGRRLDR